MHTQICGNLLSAVQVRMEASLLAKYTNDAESGCRRALRKNTSGYVAVP